MVAKKVKESDALATNGSKPPMSLIAYDEVIETPKGNIRLIADGETLETYMTQYKDQLCIARGIPLGNETTPEFNALVVIQMEGLIGITDEKERAAAAIDYVNGHYAVLVKDALNDAVILALAANEDNSFTFDPDPYDDDNVSFSLPGIVALPRPKRNLTHPVERFLKQIYDIFDSNREAALALVDAMEIAGVIFTQRAHEERNKPTTFQS